MTESTGPVPTTETLPPYSMFKDSQGMEWKLLLTVGLIEQVQEEGQLDLSNMLKDPKEFATLLVHDPKKLVMGLWVMCEEQAKFCGLDAKQFGKRFDRDTLDRAVDALCDAVVAFYPRGSAGRVLRGRLPAILKEMDQEISRKTAEKLQTSFNTPMS